MFSTKTCTFLKYYIYSKREEYVLTNGDKGEVSVVFPPLPFVIRV